MNIRPNVLSECELMFEWKLFRNYSASIEVEVAKCQLGLQRSLE